MMLTQAKWKASDAGSHFSTNRCCSMTNLTPILSLAEAAAHLKLTEHQLTRLATGPRPKIGSLVLGRVRVFPLNVIEEFVVAATTPAAPPNPWGLTDASLRRVQRSEGSAHA
jgi:hypothetical protein